MGVVYEARHPELGRTVAIKLLVAGRGATPAMRRRFQREVEAQAKLRHPHIVPIHEAGEHDSEDLVRVARGGGFATPHHLASATSRTARRPGLGSMDADRGLVDTGLRVCR
jgi:serine/threonine protein kinase